MPKSIAMWLREPGNDIIFADAGWVNMSIDYVDEDDWFYGLETGLFEWEYRRLEGLRKGWLKTIGYSNSEMDTRGLR